MLRLAYKGGKLLRSPVIEKLKEADARSGFFEPEQFQAGRKHLPDDVQAAVTIAYTYGWRMQSEVLALERRHPDLAAGTLRLDAGMTKNGKGRVVYLTLVVGIQRRDFRKAWLTACDKAGVPGKLRHDFRRTQQGTSCAPASAMTVTGHLTRSVFDRYNIVSSTDLQGATRRISPTSAY